MLISVVVPVRNEAANIQRALNGLGAQQFDPSQFEVIVVDGESVDATTTIVKEVQATFPNLHLYSNPKRLSSAARNIGIQNSRGRYVVIIDGHCEISDPQYLTNLVCA